MTPNEIKGFISKDKIWKLSFAFSIHFSPFKYERTTKDYNTVISIVTGIISEVLGDHHQ